MACGYKMIGYSFDPVQRRPGRTLQGADPEIFDRGGPEAIKFWKEGGGAKSHKMALNAYFSHFFFIKLLHISHQKGGGWGVEPLP